jgi:hypothetical protein
MVMRNRTPHSERLKKDLGAWLCEGDDWWDYSQRCAYIMSACELSVMTVARVISGNYVPGIRTQAALRLAMIQYAPEKKREDRVSIFSSGKR